MVETIFALSTPPGRSGVAVMRLSGSGCRFAVESIAGKLPAPRKASLRALKDPENGEVIDRGLVLWFPGPHSFTGEDCAEFHVHGSRAVLDRLAGILGRLDGCRAAAAGEFTRRGFEAGRLDLTAVEGLADLIDAETEAQRKQALRQLEGGLAVLYRGWRDRLLGLQALVETVIDFSDEDDVSGDVTGSVVPEVSAVISDIRRHLDDGHRGERLREGIRVVLSGAVNAGKSSLLNAIARRDVVIVSEIPGTTRDSVEVELDLGGILVRLADTAGLRETSDLVEAEGVRRARMRISEADVVLDVVDLSGPLAVQPRFGSDQGQRILVGAKADIALPGNAEEVRRLGGIIVSSKTEVGIGALLSVLEEAMATRFVAGTSAMITRERHRAALSECLAVLEGLDDSVLDTSPEVAAEQLRGGVAAIGRIVGSVGVEDVLDLIFQDFCIGK